MIMLLKRLVRMIDHFRYLRAAMPPRDALRVMFNSKSQTERCIFLNRINRHVYIRPTNSDLECLVKVFINREYEPPFELQPKLIVDAGAHIGMATLYFAHQYPEAKIIAIEPAPANFEILSKNCANLPNVILIQAALWPNKQNLIIENLSSEAWKFSIKEATPEQSGTTVTPMTVCDVLEKAHTTEVDLLKLDIEGSELQLFSMRPERWLDHIRTIAIELHDRYRPGCSHAFYSALMPHTFIQEIRGENVFVKILRSEQC